MRHSLQLAAASSLVMTIFGIPLTGNMSAARFT
jgi:hypothetical protein